jgi:SSS family solute:Na+ symporter
MIQTLPAIVPGLYTRWFDHRALLLGWLVGMIGGTLMIASLGFKSSTFPLELFGYRLSGYAAVYALLLNFAVSIVATLVVRALGLKSSPDATQPADYEDLPEESGATQHGVATLPPVD